MKIEPQNQSHREAVLYLSRIMWMIGVTKQRMMHFYGKRDFSWAVPEEKPAPLQWYMKRKLRLKHPTLE